jgi:hypothetical protein
VDALELQLICKCCRRPYHPDKVWESAWDLIVLGAEKFAICAICGQSVPQETIEDYRGRWLRAAKKHQ